MMSINVPPSTRFGFLTDKLAVQINQSIVTKVKKLLGVHT